MGLFTTCCLLLIEILAVSLVITEIVNDQSLWRIADVIIICNSPSFVIKQQTILQPERIVFISCIKQRALIQTSLLHFILRDER